MINEHRTNINGNGDRRSVLVPIIVCAGVLIGLFLGGKALYNKAFPSKQVQVIEQDEIKEKTKTVFDFSAFEFKQAEEHDDVVVVLSEEKKVEKVRTVYVQPPKPTVDWGSSTTEIASGSSVTAASPQEGEVVQGGDLSGGLASKVGFAKSRDDLDTLMNRGTLITGNMGKRIDTTYSGQVTCVIDKPVYSANGKTKLLEVGDVMHGTYDSGMVTQGVRRIAMIWDLIKADNGAVEIVMSSPGTDTLGTTGIGAKVDNHFWERFGGAILVSFIDVSVGEATNNASNTGQVIIGGAANSGSSLAQQVLQNTINIKPTLYSKEGSKCGTTLAHDFNFSGVTDVL